MKDKSAYLTCFALKKHNNATVSVLGDSTSGVMRHIQENNRKEFEAIGKKVEATSSSSIIGHFVSN